MGDRLPQLLGTVALAATDRFRASVDGSLGRAGAHASALVHLDAYPGESVQALADVLGVSQPAAVKIANRLSAGGLLERRAGRDQRTRALHLTPAGRSAAAAVLCDRGGRLGELLAMLTSDERSRLEPLLAKIVAGLADDRPGALTVCRLCDRAACCSGNDGCPLGHTTR
jgi:DNA-binding MarR family transcriptional regulator